jgi:predicted nuclease of restriction endonuclease-like (RecB) superfamily
MDSPESCRQPPYISDIKSREFYEKEAINSNWSVRELKRQIDTSLFERLLLSEGNTNKEKVLSLAQMLQR